MMMMMMMMMTHPDLDLVLVLLALHGLVLLLHLLDLLLVDAQPEGHGKDVVGVRLKLGRHLFPGFNSI